MGFFILGESLFKYYFFPLRLNVALDESKRQNVQCLENSLRSDIKCARRHAFRVSRKRINFSGFKLSIVYFLMKWHLSITSA